MFCDAEQKYQATSSLDANRILIFLSLNWRSANDLRSEISYGRLLCSARSVVRRTEEEVGDTRPEHRHVQQDCHHPAHGVAHGQVRQGGVRVPVCTITSSAHHTLVQTGIQDTQEFQRNSKFNQRRVE